MMFIVWKANMMNCLENRKTCLDFTLIDLVHSRVFICLDGNTVNPRCRTRRRCWKPSSSSRKRRQSSAMKTMMMIVRDKTRPSSTSPPWVDVHTHSEDVTKRWEHDTRREHAETDTRQLPSVTRPASCRPSLSLSLFLSDRWWGGRCLRLPPLPQQTWVMIWTQMKFWRASISWPIARTWRARPKRLPLETEPTGVRIINGCRNIWFIDYTDK